MQKRARRAIVLVFALPYLVLAEIHFRERNCLPLLEELDSYVELEPNGGKSIGQGDSQGDSRCAHEICRSETRASTMIRETTTLLAQQKLSYGGSACSGVSLYIPWLVCSSFR